MIGRPIARVAMIVATLSLIAIVGTAVASAGQPFGGWGLAAPETAVNSPQADGCPIESPNGLELYIASNRPGTVGTPDGNDIWVAKRTSKTSPWSTPVNLGVPVNSAAADFCPTPLHGNRLLFVSNRSGAQACGTAPAGDIYLTRHLGANGWQDPIHLGCDAAGTGPNFPGAEFGPSLVVTNRGTFLYFSSNGYGGDQNIYVSERAVDGSFGAATVVAELSTTSEDMMPNVSRDGLEIVFNSNRPGSIGGQDVYTAHRASVDDPWSTPVNLGPNVNTLGNETRSSLSGDGRRLHFGRDGEIYVSERANVHVP